MIDGVSPSEGRVEVCAGGDWGTVCDNLWSTEDANVVCSQLGFSNLGMLHAPIFDLQAVLHLLLLPLITDASSFGGAYFGPGVNLRIHITNALCIGSERQLVDCTYSASTSSCTHNNDAGVRCLQRKFGKHLSLCFMISKLSCYE